MLSAKISRHETWTARRAAIAQRYREGLVGLPLELVPYSPGVGHVWHKFVLRTANRDALARGLNEDGIPTAVHYATPLHREPMFGRRDHGGNSFPCAMEHAATALSLPIHAYLSDAEVERGDLSRASARRARRGRFCEPLTGCRKRRLVIEPMKRGERDGEQREPGPDVP
jgi:dTDP-4-amino-4,6-dideoxygalactose transaminase